MSTMVDGGLIAVVIDDHRFMMAPYIKSPVAFVGDSRACHIVGLDDGGNVVTMMVKMMVCNHGSNDGYNDGYDDG